jgi:hypothetical protein
VERKISGPKEKTTPASSTSSDATVSEQRIVRGVRASVKLPAPTASAKGWLGRAITKKAVVILARLFNSGENPHSLVQKERLSDEVTFDICAIWLNE